MATRSKLRPEPAELAEHEASTLLPRVRGTDSTNPAVSVSVSSRLRLAAFVLLGVIAVRVLLIGQTLDTQEGSLRGDAQVDDRFQFDGGNANVSNQILEETLAQYEDDPTTALSEPEMPTTHELPSLPPAFSIAETKDSTETETTSDTLSTSEIVSTTETMATTETVAATETMTTTEIVATTKAMVTATTVLRDACYYERDIGLIEKASTPAHVFCTNPDDASSKNRTKVTLIDAPAGIRAVVFEDLLVDLAAAKPHKDIASLAQDGGDHDPRFTFTDSMIYCGCDELQGYTDLYRAANYKLYPVWGEALAYSSRWDERDASLVCAGPNVVRPVGDSNGTNDTVVEFPGRALLIARRDDHNPFFQVSNALNTWIMLRALNWDPKTVTLVHFDAGYPSPVDALHQKLLSPSTELFRGRELTGKRLLFSGQVMLAPFETTGPMMQHLDDWEPCWESELFRTFRDEALTAMEVVEPTKEEEKQKDIIVTIISRKPYNGRVVQRRWINEDEVVRRLREKYTSFEGRKIVFRSIDFVDLSLQKQMQLMVESDVVVSMHGAGLVNVFWTRPGTLVLEIFPKLRRRWGYRNLCQFVGCDWHEFRGGRDIQTGTSWSDANANDKMIPYEEWQTFFDPLFKQQLAEISNTRAAVEDLQFDAAETLPHGWPAQEEEEKPAVEVAKGILPKKRR